MRHVGRKEGGNPATCLFRFFLLGCTSLSSPVALALTHTLTESILETLRFFFFVLFMDTVVYMREEEDATGLQC